MMEDDGWVAWQDTEGNSMFVADGQKTPVLVFVTGNGATEDVLAVFTSGDAAARFQGWLSDSFEATGMANQQLSMAEYPNNAARLQSSRRVDEAGRPPGFLEED